MYANALNNFIKLVKTATTDNTYNKRHNAAINWLTTGGRKKLYRDCPDLLFMYILQYELFLSGDIHYIPIEGARIIPVILNIGTNAKLTSNIVNFSTKIGDMCKANNRNPDSELFEIGTAIAYSQHGFSVEFIEKGAYKTPDLLLRKDGKEHYAECKKMYRTSSHSYKEIDAWYHIADSLVRKIGSDKLHYVNVIFFKGVSSCIKRKIINRVMRRLPTISGTAPNLLFCNRFLRVTAQKLDTNEISATLKENAISFQDPEFILMTTGKYDDSFGYKLYLKSDVDDGHINNVHGGSILAWKCISKESVELKSRYVRTLIREASEQIPPDKNGCIHILIEECDGKSTFLRRLAKNHKAISTFIPKNKNIDRIYLHLAKPKALPGGQFDVEETIIDYTSPTTTIEQLFSTVWYYSESMTEGLGELHKAIVLSKKA